MIGNWNCSEMKYCMPFLFSLIFCSTIKGQDKQLENKLKPYFGELPILQTPDSVLRFAFSDTITREHKSRYRVFVYYDSLSPTKLVDPNWRYDDSLQSNRLEEFDIYSKYIDMDGIADFDSQISYRNQINAYHSSDCSMLTVKIYKKNAFVAKRSYRKMKRKFSKYFAKKTTERYSSRLTSGKWTTTYYFTNKTDYTPLLAISWNGRAHMTSPGNRIYVYGK